MEIPFLSMIAFHEMFHRQTHCTNTSPGVLDVPGAVHLRAVFCDLAPDQVFKRGGGVCASGWEAVGRRTTDDLNVVFTTVNFHVVREATQIAHQFSL